ncbi:LPS assembly protein LptD [uncultured Rhodoblastus sp.]|uniref:LPS-assembly protein LptD n=1 Tax=uncultured Rhodoblastus sp. TaxID=543037 RepID=UPI0025D70143|nr:LPS assembly protein LptD [uncultured Rhodoblastus sp.]
MFRRVRVPASLAVALVFLVALSAFVARTQAQTPPPAAPSRTLNDRFAAGANSGDKKSPMVVEADRVVYDDKAHTVTAEGDAQIYYQGKVLEADRVTYFRESGRVLAEGAVKLTEPDGGLTHADRMELTGDFKQGFVDTVRADTKEKTHLSATRSEKRDENTTVFEKGTYTACPSCAEHPERPPLWRLRAEKIIHKNAEQMLYYEHAWFELYGVPIAYIPFLSTADPSVTRQSGFLAPRLTYRSTTGFGAGVPYFWAIAPNMDVTLTPMYMTRQGLFGEVEFRHRLENGYYQIMASGIHQRQDEAFASEPWGSGDRTNRGAVESLGAIWLSPMWKFGWDIARVSDKWFLNDYGLPSGNLTGSALSGNFFRETSSTVYLTGQGERGYFDLRGFSFQGMANSDLQPQLAAVWPILDYNKTIDIKPEQTLGIGGQLEIDGNLTSSSAGLASYQQIGAVTLDRQYGLYNVCRNPVTGKPDYNQGSCLMNGIGGDYTTATLQLSWQRKLIDPIGDVWTPFVFARANGNFLNYKTTGEAIYFGTDNGIAVTDIIPNAAQGAFLSTNNQFNGYVTPGVGVDWRYPLLAKTAIGNLVIEPIAQVIARPNGQNANTLVNMDAQSLVFDDTNLFEWNKYSGYDRFETGVRANYGAQFTLDMDKNGYASAMFGQSQQLAGINSYATPDMANIGLSSGLDTRASDYISRVSYSPNSNYTLVVKSRFDENTWAMRRLDAAATAHYGPVSFGAQFANYEQQPLIGYVYRREGLQFNTRYDVLEHYYVSGNVNFDLGRHYYNAFLAQPAPVFAVASFVAGVGYADDCTKLTLNYINALSDNYGYPATYTRNQTVLLTLDLRTLGSIKAPFALSPSQIQDGVRYN